MKKTMMLAAFISAITITTLSAACQAGSNETRNLSGFTKVSFGISGDLYINLGKEFKVELQGDKDLLSEIITEVSSGKLVIKKDNWHFNLNGKVTVYITMPSIEGLGVSGSGKAEIRDAVKAEDLYLNVSGSGKLVTADIAARKLDCSISGSGDILIRGKGEVENGRVAISGSGNYNGEQLQFGSLDTSISGSGNCTCNVTNTLKASVSGSGNVNYYGNPKIDARVSGSGKVRSR